MTYFYENTWKGTFDGTREELLLLLSRSADIINNEISLSGYTVETVPDIYKDRVCKAVCAQADFIDANGGIESLSDGGFSSAALGKFSYSSGNTESVKAAAICPLACGYLAPTGLLYRGVRV